MPSPVAVTRVSISDRTTRAGCADHAANPVAIAATPINTAPASRVRRAGLSCLSLMILSFIGWVMPQWQPSGTGCVATRVLSIASA